MTASPLDWFLRTASLRRREIPRVASMFTLLGLLIAASHVLKPVRASVFLSELGAERLPYAYIAAALVLGLVAAVYSRWMARVRLERLFRRSGLFFAASLVLSWWAIRSAWPFAPFVFYIWVSIITVLLPSLFWLLANHVFYANEARRLFGTLAAGGILGSVLGGGATSALVRVIGTADLLLLAAATLAFASLLVARVARSEEKRISERRWESAPRERRVVSSTARSPLSIIARSRYLTLITALTLLTTIISTVVDYQFNAAAESAFASRDALTGFFGAFFATIHAGAFVLQFFFASRILGRRGLSAGLLALPLAVVSSSLAFLAFPFLATAALVKLSDDGLGNSLYRSSVETLYVPVPLGIQSRTKGWLDLFVERTSRGVGGVLVLTGVTVLSLGTHQMSFIVLGLAAPWLLVTLALKREYVEAFRSSLARRDIDVATLTSQMNDQQSRTVLHQVLAGSDEKQILYALELLRGAADASFLEPARRLTAHPSGPVRAAALRLIRSDFRAAELDAQTLLEDGDPGVFAEAVALILERNPEAGPALLSRVLASRNTERIHAVLDRIVESPEVFEGIFDEELVLRYARSPVPEERELGAQAIGWLPGRPELVELLPALLGDGAPRVARAAAESAGRLRQEWLIGLLIDLLRRRPLRTAARKALSRMGENTVELVLNLLPRRSDPVLRRALPRALADLGDGRAVGALLASLPDPDPHYEFQAVKALGKIRARSPAIRFPAAEVDRVLAHQARGLERLAQIRDVLDDASGRSPVSELLLRALDERLESLHEQIFRTLGLVYPPEDLFNAWNAAVSGKPSVRAAALELLGNLLSRPHRESLLPILEAPTWKELSSRAAAPFGANRLEPKEALAALAVSEHPWIAACAVTRMGELGGAALLDEIDRARSHPHPWVRDAAEAIRHGRARLSSRGAP